MFKQKTTKQNQTKLQHDVETDHHALWMFLTDTEKGKKEGKTEEEQGRKEERKGGGKEERKEERKKER